jgi:hypothetical protein
LCWILLLEKYGVIFEYLPEMILKNMASIADTLSSLDINILKIQEETQEEFTIISWSEKISNSNIKSSTPMHNSLIFKEVAKFKQKRIREKGPSQPH